MALKDWKRAKSGESKSYPLVYRRKSNENDTLVIKYYYLSNSNPYEVQRNDIPFFHSKTKSEAIKYAKEYMRTH
jgi:hypothetical protein